MKKKRRIFQPLNLIVFLFFALAAEVTVCLPLFEDTNAALQLAWTGYLLLGTTFLFFVGGKIGGIIVTGKKAGRNLAASEKGKFWLGLLLFWTGIGVGAAFRLREMAADSDILSAEVSLQLLFYIGIGFLVYCMVYQVSGLGGAAAATIFLALCPLFDFHTGLSAADALYTALCLGTICLVLLAKRSLEKKELCWQNLLLTIAGALTLAGATFLRISTVVLLFPCLLFLIRKSEPKKEKERGRIERGLLFAAFYACVTAVLFILNIRFQNAWTLKFPVDYDLLHTVKALMQEPENALIALFEKLSALLTAGGQGEYENGLLMGILLFGLIRAILLFHNKIEKNYVPIYLFNWYLFGGLLLEKSSGSRLLLFLLLASAASGTMADLAGALIAGKQRKVKEEERKAEQQREEERKEEERKAEQQKEEEQKAEQQKAEQQEADKVPEPAWSEEQKIEQQLSEKSEEMKLLEASEAQPEAEEKETEPSAEAEEKEAEPPEEAEKKEAELQPEEKEAQPEADAGLLEEPEQKEKAPLPELTLEEILPGQVPIEGQKAEQMFYTAEEETSEPEAEPESAKEHDFLEEIAETEETGGSSLPMEEQIQKLLNREELIIEILEKQSAQISKLEQELKEQRILARKRERHYRQQLAITRNKKK